MVKAFLLFLLLLSSSYGIEVTEKTSGIDLLPHAQILIDTTQSLQLHEIQEKDFHSIKKKEIGFGYAPKLNVWIRFSLNNPTSRPVKKILEYHHPLTSDLELYDNQNSKPFFKGGLFHYGMKRISTAPTTMLLLPPHSSKVFILKVSSDPTALTVRLLLWSPSEYWERESLHQLILALFFGAIGVIILYNFGVFVSTRKWRYLYYSLAMLGISIHHAIFSGILTRFISSQSMETLIHYAILITAFPVFFLALFARQTLDTASHFPRLHRVSTPLLIIYLLSVGYLFISENNTLRSIPPVLLLVLIFLAAGYAALQKNRQANYFIISGSVFALTGLLMFLASSGVYDFSIVCPYYIEGSLLIIAIILSQLLADQLKQLQNKVLAEQTRFIAYQKMENQRFSNIIDEQTKELRSSLKEKNILLKELNHRVKNSMQTILSFLRLQQDNSTVPATRNALEKMENRIFAINHLYALLHVENNITIVDMQTYFSLLTDSLEESFSESNIQIYVNANKIQMEAETAVYCGFILNEALSNAYQHAFAPDEEGTIHISLTLLDDRYTFTIDDDGKGISAPVKEDETLGMTIIKTLVTEQLGGKLTVHSDQGTHITATWSRHEKV